MEMTEFSGKSVNEALMEACQKLMVTSDRVQYEVVDEGSAGFLGLGARNAVIRACVKDESAEASIQEEKSAVKNVKKSEEKNVAPAQEKSQDGLEKKVPVTINAAAVEKAAVKFLDDVFKAMQMTVKVNAKYDEVEGSLNIDLVGDDMGVLIGKRGATLDSLQYLVSLVVNRDTGSYLRVKVDTENYRARRRETLENLAHNIAYKVRRTKRPVSLEPMNPYERRIIHSALQGDKYVTTHSEGDEPYRRVVVTLRR